MRFKSTSGSGVAVSLPEAVAHPYAPDGGIYMPETMPVIPQALFNNIEGMSLRDIAFVVATSFLGNEVAAADLKTVVDYAFNCEVPLRQLSDDLFALELFHGPTLTVKDFGARFMARLMGLIDPGKKRTILVATTGNTGAAAANGFLGMPDTNVLVLFPIGRLSRTQLAQITALGNNVYPVEVTGNIEDCKRLMHMALTDPELEHFNPTGANSTNVARLIPQIVLPLHAYARLREKGIAGAWEALYSIPAGNLSNLVAAVMAKRTGLPMGRIIGASNSNDALGKKMAGKPCDTFPYHTLAPSIDMAYPSGWPRLESMFGGNLKALTEVVESVSVSDEEIAAAINDARRDFGYTFDPHGAVAYAAVRDIKGGPKVVYATGHPAKQLNIMTKITGAAIELPVQLNRFMKINRQPIRISPTLPAFRKFMNSLK